MSTLSFNGAHSFAGADFARSPRLSFAARLAVLQARQEQSPHLTALFGVAGRLALAAVPFGVLAWVFVAV